MYNIDMETTDKMKILDNPKNRRKFLKAYSIGKKSISRACHSVGITRNTYYNWVRVNPDFKREMAEELSKRRMTIEKGIWKDIVDEDTDPRIKNQLRQQWLSRNYAGYADDSGQQITINVPIIAPSHMKLAQEGLNIPDTPPDKIITNSNVVPQLNSKNTENG